MLTGTGTLLSRVIGLYTKRELNHTSIAFDEQLNEMYSFGRKRLRNPLVAGFVKENAGVGIFKGARCAIYSCQVSPEDYARMYEKIKTIEENKDEYKYNFIGLFGVALNKGINRENAYFCSEFVASVMNESESLGIEIPPSLIQPWHFSDLPYLQLKYEGDLQSYYLKQGAVNEENFSLAND